MSQRGAGPLRVGIVGCGNIAEAYARDIGRHDELRLTALTDRNLDRATKLAVAHGGQAVGELDALIEAVDLVVNLTPPRAHVEVTRRSLEAGRHVYSEKPLAIESADAHELVHLARRTRARLGCAPSTLLGEGQQTAWKALRDGRAGTIRAVFAEVNWGSIERWHPKPAPFYEVGPLVDVGVYPLAIITGCLGPVRRVRSFGKTLTAERVAIDGTHFAVTTPDFQVTLLELEDGTVARLTTSYYVGQQSKNHAALEFHGDEGSVALDHFFKFDAAVEVAKLGDGESYASIPHVRQPEGHVDWARALVDMAVAIRDDLPHRATGEHAAHVVDVVCAAAESQDRGGLIIEVTSRFPQPEPMPWALADVDAMSSGVGRG